MRSSDRLWLPFDSGSTEEYNSNHDVVAQCLIIEKVGPGKFQLPDPRAPARTELDH